MSPIIFLKLHYFSKFFTELHEHWKDTKLQLNLAIQSPEKPFVSSTVTRKLNNNIQHNFTLGIPDTQTHPFTNSCREPGNTTG